MDRGQITMAVFQSLDAYWPGLQVGATHQLKLLTIGQWQVLGSVSALGSMEEMGFVAQQPVLLDSNQTSPSLLRVLDCV